MSGVKCVMGMEAADPILKIKTAPVFDQNASFARRYAVIAGQLWGRRNPQLGSIEGEVTEVEVSGLRPP